MTAQPPTVEPKANTVESPLFRSEVTAALGGNWMGAIRLAQPLSSWLVASIALTVAIALIAFLSLGSITKKARVTGVTVPSAGNISVAAPNAGVLTQSHIKEGDIVQAGQVLFTLSTQRQNSQGEITALIANQLRSRQDTLRMEQRLRESATQERKLVLQQRLANLRIESEQIDQEIQLAKRRLNLSQQSIDKFQTLQNSGYVSAAQTQQKIEENIDLSTRLSSLQRNKIQLQANQVSVQAEINTLANTLATELAQLNRVKAALLQEIAENSNRHSSQIVAPQAGMVTAITNQTGQNINGGQVLATLIPVLDSKGLADGQALEVHLYAPSKTAGFVSAGQQVLIRYNAYPYQKFGLQAGTVIDVSKTPFAPNELPQHLASTILSNAQQNILGFNSNEALYRIKVQLKHQTINAYGQAQTIKPGMTLEADVVQDKRKIWEWIIEPVLAVTKTAEL
jgi:membrane fusion protein